MSQLLIHDYLNQLATLKKVSGSTRESVVREAFKDLLKGWARSRDLTFVPEYEIETKTGERRYIDGALLYALRLPFGYWEAKDENDDLEAEIAIKFRRGYPQDNILFEDSHTAILYQNREEVARCAVDDVKSLEKLLDVFFAYERREIAEFRKAVEQFQADLPAVLEALRQMIETAHAASPGFRKAASAFLTHAQETINPSLTEADVREMLIQHILTEEIFSAVFPGTSFHKDNNVARELYKLEETFFTGNTKFQTLKGLEPYYAAIRAAAARIESHHEKQTFLKAIYENFYKVYNKKAADRLGVVYTPNEIVRFMIDGADWLCERTFSRHLIDNNVDILDPATGTGTFVCELLEHFRGQPKKLAGKYLKELHANEVAILPYYVANLNIEATYAAITGQYVEYPNLCFVDTLDNTAGLRKHAGHIDDLFGGVTDVNIKRIREQNSRRISVIIGNPPYNANQLNENENNKNREYPEIDKRIKDTYIAASTAQKTKLYDMYARFLRWATDRVDENGIIAFVSNSSFIDSRTFDGFRRIVSKEFNEIWLLDLKGNARTNGERRRQEAGNVFDDQIRVGIAVYFLVRKKGVKGCRIYYHAIRDYAKSDEKREFLVKNRLGDLAMTEITPDENCNWINLADTDFDTLLPLVSKEEKQGSAGRGERAILKLFANGVKSNRDEWVYDFSPDVLKQKVDFFYEKFQAQARRPKDSEFDTTIKWSRDLKLKLDRKIIHAAANAHIARSMWRPFVFKAYWADKTLSDILTDLHARMFGPGLDKGNKLINIPAPPLTRTHFALASHSFVDYHCVGDTNSLPLWVFDENGTRISNVTDWALEKFQKHYKNRKSITKDAIFEYVYAVLHDPEYREKYALNLKRDYPRIPLYPDFAKWANLGKRLLDLHLGFESVQPSALKVLESKDKDRQSVVLLRVDKDGGRIVVDSQTTLAGIPSEVWQHKLGNLSALEWIVEQFKEVQPKDPTIRELFNTYNFADYKDQFIDLAKRVTTVSVQTMDAIEQMNELARQ